MTQSIDNYESPFHYDRYDPRNKDYSQQGLHAVFGTVSRSYLNEFKLYTTRYNAIPNIHQEIKIDCKKAIHWFRAHYANDIQDQHFSKVYYDSQKNAEVDDVFFYLYDDLLVDFDTNQSEVRILFRKTPQETLDKLVHDLKKFRKKKKKDAPEFQVLIYSQGSLEIRPFKITKPKLSIADNYNEDFLPVHDIILKRLSKKGEKGLVLLHGKPGTGKTNYVRYLISSLKKEVIFLPPTLAGSVTNPDLMQILVHSPNSVLVIEDAENIITDREQNGHSPVSALLNLSDGILSDCLNIQVVCSFNTDISRIDPALMRKGRLIAKYEFKELEKEKAAALSAKLGFKTDITGPMTLTDIYNQNEAKFEQPKQSQIGFRKYNG